MIPLGLKWTSLIPLRLSKTPLKYREKNQETTNTYTCYICPESMGLEEVGALLPKLGRAKFEATANEAIERVSRAKGG